MNLYRAIDIDFGQLLLSLKKNRLKIFAALICGILAGTLYVFVLDEKEDRYRAEASVYSMADGSYENTAAGMNAIRAYSYIIKSIRIADRAAELIGNETVTGEEIYNMISTDEQVIQGTTYVYENQNSIIRIYADDTNEMIAVEAVNAVAEAYAEEINRIFGSPFVHVLDYADYGQKTYDASRTRFIHIVLAGAAAALLFIMYLTATVVFSKCVVSARDASLYGQLDVLAEIPEFKYEMGAKKERKKERKKTVGAK